MRHSQEQSTFASFAVASPNIYIVNDFYPVLPLLDHCHSTGVTDIMYSSVATAGILTGERFFGLFNHGIAYASVNNPGRWSVVLRAILTVVSWYPFKQRSGVAK